MTPYLAPMLITRPSNVADIVQIVSDAFGIPISAVTADDRKQPGADARYMAMYFMAKYFGLKHFQIGMMFNRNPSDVAHAKRFVKQTVRTNRTLKDRFESIAYRLGYGPEQINEMIY